MKYYPVFINLRDQRIAVAGTGECAVAKLRLLMKTEAQIDVYGTDPVEQVEIWAEHGDINLIQRPLKRRDLRGAKMVYAAHDDHDLDMRVARLARRAGVLLNVVDDLQNSQFITPALVDRDPVTIAIGTEGAAPVLARKIKQSLEEQLPADLGDLTQIGQSFRPELEKLSSKRRRAFWARFYDGTGLAALRQGGPETAKDTLRALLKDVKADAKPIGKVILVGAGPGDPELLTLKARKALHDADVVLHDQLVPAPILELARREAEIIETGKRGFGKSWKQDDINALMIEKANEGNTVIRLKSGDPAVFSRLDEELDALRAAKIEFSIIPGVTSASAASTAIGRSLTKKGRNSSLQLLTGHDMKGFAEHDWRALAASSAVSAIYMGRRAASMMQGRLLEHGANPELPVTIVASASQPDQIILQTKLRALSETLDEKGLDKAAIILLGLAPDEGSTSSDSLPKGQS